MRHTLKLITILTLVFTFLFILIYRENKISKLEHYEQKYFIMQELQKIDSINSELHTINRELTNNVNIMINQNDSLMLEVSIKEVKLKEAKKILKNEKSNTILYAPDSTIVRILSEHNIRTND